MGVCVALLLVVFGVSSASGGICADIIVHDVSDVDSVGMYAAIAHDVSEAMIVLTDVIVMLDGGDVVVVDNQE